MTNVASQGSHRRNPKTTSSIKIAAVSLVLLRQNPKKSSSIRIAAASLVLLRQNPKKSSSIRIAVASPVLLRRNPKKTSSIRITAIFRGLRRSNRWVAATITSAIFQGLRAHRLARRHPSCPLHQKKSPKAHHPIPIPRHVVALRPRSNRLRERHPSHRACPRAPMRRTRGLSSKLGNLAVSRAKKKIPKNAEIPRFHPIAVCRLRLSPPNNAHSTKTACRYNGAPPHRKAKTEKLSFRRPRLSPSPMNPTSARLDIPITSISNAMNRSPMSSKISSPDTTTKSRTCARATALVNAPFSSVSPASSNTPDTKNSPMSAISRLSKPIT